MKLSRFPTDTDNIANELPNPAPFSRKRPFRGSVSLKPTPLQLVYEQLLKPQEPSAISDTTQSKDKL